MRYEIQQTMFIQRVIGLLFIFLLYFTTLYSQKNECVTELSLGVSEVSLIKATSVVISLQLKQRDAGLSLETSTSDSTARLLISSVVSEQPRTLSARISDGVVPPGTQLQLEALPPNVNFVGDAGLYSAPIILDQTDKPFVTQITTCYSGTDLTDGYSLKFIFTLNADPSTYGSIRATSTSSVSVTITLTAAI